MIYLVVRLSFDSMENEIGCARYKTIEGYATTREAAEAFMSTRRAVRRKEWDGQEYPRWEIKEVGEL